jgi:hypothetical protein
MKSCWRKLHLAFVVPAAALLATSALAKGGSNPMIGTWKLNLAKSKYTPGPAPKSLTVKIEQAGDGVKVTSEGVDGEDKPIAIEFTANYDGKDYPITGSQMANTVSLKRTGPRTARRIDKKDGKVVQTGSRVVAKDGKSYTFTTKGKNAKGQRFHNIAVYDKQ